MRRQKWQFHPELGSGPIFCVSSYFATGFEDVTEKNEKREGKERKERRKGREEEKLGRDVTVGTQAS